MLTTVSPPNYLEAIFFHLHSRCILRIVEISYRSQRFTRLAARIAATVPSLSARCRRCRLQVLEAVTSRAKEAETIRDHMVRVKDRAIALVDQIACDKQLAEQKLELARPALEMAEAALNTIKPAHIG